MEDIKNNIALNIIELRKNAGYSQLELAQKLNYSDKAISKWERAESIPDIVVLKQIADIFGVSLDYLITDDHKKQKAKTEELLQSKRKNHIIISSISAFAVWAVAVFVFVILSLTTELSDLWKIFFYSLPPFFVVILIFNSIWGRRFLNYTIVSLLCWSILLLFYIIFLEKNMLLIFLIGIPAQIIIIITSLFTKNKNKI